MKEIFSVFSGILVLISFIPYILSILSGATKPAKATWVTWAFINFILSVAMYIENALNYQITVVLVGDIGVALLALKYGRSGWSLLDKLCIILAVLGMWIWYVFSSPVLGIVAAIFASLIGFIPTIVSTYQDPNRENKLSWTIFWTSSIFATLAIPDLEFAKIGQPLAYLLTGAVMMFLLFINPKLKNL